MSTREKLLDILKSAASDKDFQWTALKMLCDEIDKLNEKLERKKK